jgi:hypothetical protein
MVDPETEFTSSNLPIIFIDTDGKEIEDAVRISAHMGIIYNSLGRRNQVSDPYNNYDGKISIETRGSVAELFPKKSYRFETHDAQDMDDNVSLLGMPSENDWILYAPFLDISMIRNVLAYTISNDIGRYASRTQFCELVLNNEYQGVYVLMEKIKRDNERVDIARMDENDIAGDSLTGGYIIKLDKPSGENVGWWYSDMGIQYQYDYPKADRILDQQKEYIKDYMNNFEAAVDNENFADPRIGYPAYINTDSFVDHFILNEFFRNIDAYRISAFLYKHRDSQGGKLNAGPIWDFNLSSGLAFFSGDAGETEGWVVDYNKTHPGDSWLVPFWWEKIAHESNFQSLAAQRWAKLRQGVLNINELLTRIDHLYMMLKEARYRNWLYWSDEIATWLRSFDPSSFEEDSLLIQEYFPQRLAWLDEQFDYIPDAISQKNIFSNPERYELRQNYPNPFNPITMINYQLQMISNVELSIYNLLGQKVATLIKEKQQAGYHQVEWNASGFASGVYYYTFQAGNEFAETKKMLLIR